MNNKYNNNKKKIYFFCFICFIFIFNVKAENVDCKYVLKEGSCQQSGYEKLETGEKFTVVINVDNKKIGNPVIDNHTINYMNNTEAVAIKGFLEYGGEKVSAVDYYNKTGETCPPYFGIDDTGVSFQYDGYFLDSKTDMNEAYTVCRFPVEQKEYTEDFELKDEIYSCSLYSSDPVYADMSINVEVNYTKKTIDIDGAVSEAFVDYKNNFDFSKKNKCPINELKLCMNGDISWVYPIDYEDTYVSENLCTKLDISEKLKIGDTYCGIFVDYAKDTSKFNYLKEFCKINTQYGNYSSDEFSCISMCLNMEKYVDSGFIITSKACGISEKLAIYISNIVKWVKYIVPVLAIVLGILDFIKAIAADKDDEMKKAQGRFIKRLIAAALIFIIPFIIEFVLDIMGFERYIEGCGIIDL